MERVENQRSAGLPDTWSRVVILGTRPQVDCGRYPVRRTTGEEVEVLADIVADGHDLVAAEVLYGPEGGETRRARLAPSGNDLYAGSFEPDTVGCWVFRVRAWIDRFATWQELFRRRVEGGSPASELASELLEGAALLRRAAENAAGADREALAGYVAAFSRAEAERALEPELLALAARYDPRAGAALGPERHLLVERPLARYGAWYEFFPRSAGEPGRHGTLDDAAARLEYVKELGFDVVYLPPIHPIGRTHRKGRDNAEGAGPGDPGSPWAIGSAEGGHRSVHPELGGMAAFERFRDRAAELGLEVALDLAYQASPDHPWVTERPDWFRRRPDGSIRYAENPPKKYQDIYPLDFESSAWRELWLELRGVIEFWAERGVRTFRVDNPHTKPLAFWEWCLGSVRARWPDLVFLSEAFTRPKLMYALAKAGFSQSYTYFTWRYNKHELAEYLQEITSGEVAEFFRPNFWPNTPDILPPYLRERATFEARLVLAATLSASYGIYGPAFELMLSESHPEREEYAGNEKYELRAWDVGSDRSLAPTIALVNRIRRENEALHQNRNLAFHEVDNDQLLAYSKRRGSNLVLVVVNFDPRHSQSGFVRLPLAELGLPESAPYQLRDLITGETYFWEGDRNYVELDPHRFPAHVFRVERGVRREQDYGYYQ